MSPLSSEVPLDPHSSHERARPVNVVRPGYSPGEGRWARSPPSTQAQDRGHARRRHRDRRDARSPADPGRSEESTTARETTRTAVRAMSANVATSTLLGVRSEVQAEHDFLPFRRPLDDGAPSLTDAAGLTAQPGSVSSAVQAAQQAPHEAATQRTGSAQLEAERQVLKQQALATTRVTWNTRSTQYTTVLAVLAAALFLVGFGLVVEGRSAVSPTASGSRLPRSSSSGGPGSTTFRSRSRRTTRSPQPLRGRC